MEQKEAIYGNLLQFDKVNIKLMKSAKKSLMLKCSASDDLYHFQASLP